jgi:hypothetical protein
VRSKVSPVGVDGGEAGKAPASPARNWLGAANPDAAGGAVKGLWDARCCASSEYSLSATCNNSPGFADACRGGGDVECSPNPSFSGPCAKSTWVTSGGSGAGSAVEARY